MDRRQSLFGRRKRFSIFHRVQEEALRWSRGAGGAAVKCCENCRNVFAAEISAANVEHGADEVTHHVVQKAVAANSVNEQIAAGFLGAPRPVRGIDGSNCCSRLCLIRGISMVAGAATRVYLLACGLIGIGGSKAAEVVLADKHLRRFL